MCEVRIKLTDFLQLIKETFEVATALQFGSMPFYVISMRADNTLPWFLKNIKQVPCLLFLSP